jgi:DNA adenine methylase
MAFGGEQRHASGWRYITYSHGKASRLVREWNDLRGLEFAVDRLRQVQIECDDALDVIARFDTPDTLFYVDPPYVLSSRAEGRHRYAHEMTDDQHRALADTLRAVRGTVVLSGYRSALYDTLYAGWPRFDRVVANNGNSTSTECVWVSPRAAHLNAPPMFQLLEAQS